MRKLELLACLVALAPACAGDSGDGAPEASEPLECDRDDRSGTYLFEYTEIDGNCGPAVDTLARLGNPNLGMEGTSECVVTDERWSRNNCRLEDSLECLIRGDLALYTGFSDSNASGSRLTGKFTVVVEFVCSSTYEFTATRQ